MRSARHQLILLGFLCQGLAWGDYLLPLAYAALWVGCVRRTKPAPFAGPAFEGGMLLGGCVAGFGLGWAFGHSVHFFLGHGLVLLQAARMLRPLNRREKLLSLLIALFHLAVGCTFLFDLRFIPLFLLVLYLAPRALLELEAEAFGPTASPAAPRGRIGGTAYAVIAAITVAFFLLFPRAFLRTSWAAPRAGSGESAGLLDAELDPARSGLAQSRRVVFHIEGERIGYLRSYSLTEFDGTRWRRADRAGLRPIVYAPWRELNRYVHRRVSVKHSAYLGRVLPTDGHVVFLYGRFFGRPLVNANGGIETDSMWNTARNVYDYWIDPQARAASLPWTLRNAYTRYPPPSARLREWLDRVLAGIADPYDQALRLETILREQFTYDLGAPELNRAHALEEFLFDQKRGHCERFAAALTALLRIRGIPSRIAVGYLPISRNALTGGYNVRFKDAHAWTEAFFPNRGWVQLDATPRASLPADDWGWRELLADADYAWSAFVVNFDGPTQTALVTTSMAALAQAPTWMRDHTGFLAGSVAAAAMVVLAVWWRRRGRGATPSAGLPPPVAVVYAEHFYAQMLRALARLGWRRRPHQTPLEFLAGIDAPAATPSGPPAPARSPAPPQPGPFLDRVRRLTHLFCAVRYGGRDLTPDEKGEVRHAVGGLSHPDPPDR